VSLSTRRYQVASITQNNHVYEDLVEYFRSEVSLNLRSQVNVQNANNYLNTLRIPQHPPYTLTPSVYQLYVKQLPQPPPYTFADTVTIALTYLKKYENDINPETWSRDINPTNAEQQDLNGFLLHRIAHYKDSKYDNTALWECIREDFIGWTKET
jgi:hypothetical protein